MVSLIALLVAAQGAPFLNGLQEDVASGGFNSWKGHPSAYQRYFRGRRGSAKVAEQAKRFLDPQLWELLPSNMWHNEDGTRAQPCSLFNGRPGTVVDGWSVQIDWNWGSTSKAAERLGYSPGWTSVMISARCTKEETKRAKELFTYLFDR